jgi:hypothetical protein
VTAPQFLALARREHVGGGGVEDRGAAGRTPRAAAVHGVEVRPTIARGDRGPVTTALYRGA